MRAAFHEGKKMIKLTRYLDEVPNGKEVEASMVSKQFCLSNAAAAGKFIWMREILHESDLDCGGRHYERTKRKEYADIHAEHYQELRR